MDKPIGILLHVGTLSSVPILIHDVTTRIEDLIIVFVIFKVLSSFNTATWEVVQSD